MANMTIQNESLLAANNNLDDETSFHTTRCDDDDDDGGDDVGIIKSIDNSLNQEHDNSNDIMNPTTTTTKRTKRTNGIRPSTNADITKSDEEGEVVDKDANFTNNVTSSVNESPAVDEDTTTKEDEKVQHHHHIPNSKTLSDTQQKNESSSIHNTTTKNNKNINTTTPTRTIPAPTTIKVLPPLHSKWSLWFDHPKAAPAGSDWKEKLKLCGTFQTVDGFWRVFNNIKPASDLSVQSNYSVFRYGIEPSWEDPANCDGGKFVLTILKKEGKAGRTNECWLLTVLAVIGETMDIAGNQVNGAVVSLRKHEDRVALWLKSSEPRICVSIGERWKKVLSIEKNVLKFVTHRTAASTGRSFRNDSEFEV